LHLSATAAVDDAGADANPANVWGPRCVAPDTAAASMTSADVPGTLAGQWWLCNGAAEFYYSVEFSADRHWYSLTNVGESFVRNYGPQTSGTYTIATQGSPSITFEMKTVYTDGSTIAYPLHGTLQPASGKLSLGGGMYVRMTP
jgi:hypothetical protein